MKNTKIIALLIIVMTIYVNSDVIYAQSRVIYEVTELSEHSAQIELKWNDNSTENIQIVSWNLINEDTLKIVYITGENMPSGWNKRKIEGNEYNFPIKIILEEQKMETQTFTDLPKEDEIKYSILNLYYRDIINGYTDGTFKPKNLVTRAEFAKMITKAAQYKLDKDIKSSFKDVSNDFWGLDYIMTLANKEIIKGRPDGTFDSNGNISIGEVLTIINRTFIFYNGDGNYSYTLPSHWSNEDFIKLAQVEIVKNTDSFYYPYTPDRKATREECAILISRILEQINEVK